jgi:hypothetical protein
MEAAMRIFRQAQEVVGHTPERVTTAGHDAYPRAIRETCGEEALHGCNQYLNNRSEQHHRGVKQRSDPMQGCGIICAIANAWETSCLWLSSGRSSASAWPKCAPCSRLLETQGKHGQVAMHICRLLCAPSADATLLARCAATLHGSSPAWP